MPGWWGPGPLGPLNQALSATDNAPEDDQKILYVATMKFKARPPRGAAPTTEGLFLKLIAVLKR